MFRRRVLRGDRKPSLGQSLVEFALVLPVVMLLFVATLDLGRAAAAQVGLTNAAREGAFQAALTPTDFNAGVPCPADGSTNKIWCRIKLEASGGAAIAASDVSVSCKPGTCAAAVGAGSTVTVRVNGRFHLFTPLMGVFFNGQDITLSASATEHREWLPTTTTPTPVPTPTPGPSPTPGATPTPTPVMCLKPSAGFIPVPSDLSNVHHPFALGVIDTSTSSGCSINSWVWSWGDGYTSSGSVPGAHIYAAKGVYYVTLTVTNGAGSNTSASLELRVK